MKVLLNCDLPEQYLSWPFHERVCLMVGRHRNGVAVVDEFRPVRNVHEDPTEHFSIGLHCYNAVVSSLPPGRYVIGLMHSHLRHHDPEPSGWDLLGLPSDWVGGVYHVPTRSVRWYMAEDPAMTTGSPVSEAS